MCIYFVVLHTQTCCAHCARVTTDSRKYICPFVLNFATEESLIVTQDIISMHSLASIASDEVEV